ncbi:MAG: type III pantothenate kinase [Elusimicrobiaceae bacterium]|nr:type III pantothenate kinase [Elusimicrobiaceae bacterium]
MLLTIDVGNTQIYCGVLKNKKVVARFRHTSSKIVTSDELGVFLLNALTANKIKIKEIKQVAISSVVPAITRSIIHSVKKYFDLDPFVIDQNTKTKIFCKSGSIHELGADRLADIEGAFALHQKNNFIIMDFGTAITFDAVTKKGEYLGGAICAGPMLTMQALASGTALLSTVELKKPKKTMGLTTETQIQAGLVLGTIGLVKEIISRTKKECFGKEKVLIIGTGGLGRLFEKENIFDFYEPDLILFGLESLIKGNK